MDAPRPSVSVVGRGTPSLHSHAARGNEIIKKHGGHADQLSQQHWGMDRFRITALQKIIEGGQLTADNQQAAVAMLVKKAEIYLNGMIKRGKTDEVHYYQQLIKRFTA